MSDMSQTPRDLSTPDERREALLQPTVVLGAGPAGLTAGYMLAKHGLPVTVLEAEDQVGGLAKTVERDGYRFDLGGHRFFTKSQEIDALWHEVLDDEFLLRPRMSRIYWNGRFLDYPLRGTDVIRKLGPVELTRASASYLRAAIKPQGQARTASRSGSRTGSASACSSSSSAPTPRRCGACRPARSAPSGRPSGSRACRSAAPPRLPSSATGDNVKSLIGEFHYPRFGPGQMWEAMTAEIHASGGEVRSNRPSSGCESRTAASWRSLAGGEAIEPGARDLLAAAARDRRASTEPAPPDDVARRPAGCATATS